jgi:hypothetical protein
MPATPLRGDRSAWNMFYPSLHASDIESGNLLFHTPAPSGAGVILYSSDGVKWTSIKMSQIGVGSTTRMTPFYVPGELQALAGETRVYNLWGSAQKITKVFLSVSEPPTTQDIIVDVLRDGASIFTNQNNRPRIEAGEYTGYTIAIDSDMWYSDSYITVDVDQIGSGTVGSNLTVHIVHVDSVGSLSASRHCFINCQVYGEAYASAHAFIEGIAANAARAHAPCFIQTESADAVGSAHCFIEGTNGTKVSASKHAYMTSPNWGSFGRQTNQNFSANSEYITFTFDYEFSDEPADPDSMYVANPSYLAHNAIEIRQSGLYEIIVYTDTYGVSEITAYVARVNTGTLAHVKGKPIGDSGGLTGDWKDRSYCCLHWVGYLEEDENSPDYIDVRIEYSLSNNQVFGSSSPSYSPRVIVRRLG